MICLVQGAAQHYYEGSCGVNDFDVLILLCHPPGTSPPGQKFPNRLVKEQDFGDPKFGRHSARNPGYVGRTVDLLVRAVRCTDFADPIATARAYLESSARGSLGHWKKRPIYALFPDEISGTKIWPV
jgi:hypothetical protein